ncbi:MAG: hypothetical protein AMK72_14290 [Planctomycetes bacterium SM23_25]|nr:MAG: hypothetical protein AMS14_03765 [Planctomycetes bacterium DG_20]KPK42458.1 MAG: hypothetical protein AMK72_14290 [Planctomycetes bacterium SM23_25]
MLQREIEPLLTRPVGRPSNKPVVWYHDLLHQAGSWDKPRRVVAKIERHKGEWFPRVGFLVTNLRRPSWRVVKFYNGRGTARPEADGARKDPKPPRKSLTNPRDKEILALDAPGRSWEYPLGEMSEERDLDCIGEVSCRVAG